jgi:acyl-CoA thioester hydrolase
MSAENDSALPVRFEHAILAGESDSDANGHVNNVVYLRWVQEAAVAHWTSLAAAEVRADVSWVVVRHEIDYRRPAFPGDTLVARTWVETVTAATMERWCEILRREGRLLLAKSRTIWCAIDSHTGRPRRIDSRIRSFFQPDQSDPATQWCP